jgi:hypothetical protein
MGTSLITVFIQGMLFCFVVQGDLGVLSSEVRGMTSSTFQLANRLLEEYPLIYTSWVSAECHKLQEEWCKFQAFYHYLKNSKLSPALSLPQNRIPFLVTRVMCPRNC